MNEKVLKQVFGANAVYYPQGAFGAEILVYDEPTLKGTYDGYSMADACEKIKKWLVERKHDVLCCHLFNGKVWVQLCTFEDAELKSKTSPYFHGNSELECLQKAVEWWLKNYDK